MTEGMVYSRADFTWLPRDEYERRRAEREERAFQRRATQGQLCAPMLISDSLGLRGVQSQADGQHYDSKSRLRRHYRDAGVIEVGNDVPKTRIHGDGWKDPKAKAKRMDAIGKAFNRVGLPTV